MKEYLVCYNCQKKLTIPSNFMFEQIITVLAHNGYRVGDLNFNGEESYMVGCKHCGIQMVYQKEE